MKIEIKYDSFAEACYDQNSLEELRDALSSPADLPGMKQWGLSEQEYFDQIETAAAVKLIDLMEKSLDGDYSLQLKELEDTEHGKLDIDEFVRLIKNIETEQNERAAY